MATSSAQALKLNRFQQRTLVVFGLIAVLASLPDSERRGLLVWNSPEALIADVAEGKPGGLGGGLTLVSATGVPRRAAVLSGTVVTDALDPVGNPAAGAIPGSPLAQPQPSPPVGLSTVPAGAGSQSNPVTGSIPVGPGVGFAPAVIGATTLLVDPPAVPEVPAIPEPSSWILMILGVGFLGAALRHAREVGRFAAKKRYPA